MVAVHYFLCRARRRLCHNKQKDLFLAGDCMYKGARCLQEQVRAISTGRTNYHVFNSYYWSSDCRHHLLWASAIDTHYTRLTGTMHHREKSPIPWWADRNFQASSYLSVQSWVRHRDKIKNKCLHSQNKIQSPHTNLAHAIPTSLRCTRPIFDPHHPKQDQCPHLRTQSPRFRYAVQWS